MTTTEIMADEFKIAYPLTYDEIYRRGRADAIDEFANVVLTELENGVGGSIEDFIREYAKQMKGDK